ncbi:serine/threonine protein kinase [Achromobacter deleyi]|uniref:Serine/threonine protein kinase n=1 Tax=Achromobacter deleyi TaxID=1353891 RepID=A0A7T4B6C0_9BURK|nr:serine/threonine protein kinase [Achromobacter deleyi]QQB36467.1 serine/threonine protein kinase [Achromobacter deleyi]
MSSPAGPHTPRSPFSGAAPLALRPLSAIAASAAGGVPETRIKRLLSDLLPSLMGLHAQGEICGDISLDTVGMDEGARAHLLPELSVPRSRRSGLTPVPGFAPFELYTDSAEWPRGPWTDVYALCAVMHALVIGLRPPPAPERRATDSYEPLASLGLTKYSPAFLDAIDRGLAMLPADRPQTLGELAALLDIAVYVDESPAAPETAAAEVMAAPAAPPAVVAKPRGGGGRPLLLLLLLLALIGAGAYAWIRSGLGTGNALITRSEVVQPNPPAAPVAPPAASPAPPAAEPTPSQAAAPAPQAALPETPAPDAGGTAPPPPATAEPDANAAPATPGAQEPAAPAAAPPEEAPKPKPVPVLVRLDIRPWGEVWINGVARGISPPVKELRLIPGKYQVLLRNADLPPYRATLEVKAGKPAVISHAFQ